MAIQTIYYSALVGHIVGLTLMAGTTVSDYIVFRQFWKQIPSTDQKASSFKGLCHGFPCFLASGSSSCDIGSNDDGDNTWCLW